MPTIEVSDTVYDEILSRRRGRESISKTLERELKPEAACETGVRFVARIRPGDTNRFAGRTGVEAIVEDLHELRDYLRGRVCSSRPS